MALPPLPDDIIYEVFTRTSLETLGRIRQLSKVWNQVTYDSTFMQQFRQRTKTISGFFIQNFIHGKHRSSFVSLDDDDQNLEAHKVSLSFLPPGPFRSSSVNILASAPQGILLCEKDTQKSDVRQYYVCKPTTKQWQAIPNPKTRYFTKAIGMVVLGSNPLRYKIVRFSARLSMVKYKSEWHHSVPCEVFDSETWAWKQFKEDIRFPHNLYLSEGIALVSACGKINWLLPDNHIFTFDLNTESWEIFALPWEVVHDECEDDEHDDGDEPYGKYEKLGQVLEIVGYEGRLGLVCMGRDDECISLWVMEEYGHKKVWRKRKKISIEELKRKEHQTSLLTFCNTDVVLMKGYYKLIFYEFENYCSTCTTFSKVVPWEEPTINQVFALESDFEPVYLGPKQPLPDLKSAPTLN